MSAHLPGSTPRGFSRPPRPVPRHGIALVAVLGALTMVGLLLLAVGGEVRRAQRTVVRDVASHAAFALAERALYGTLVGWPGRRHLALARGSSRRWSEPTAATAAGDGDVTVTASRLSPAVFRIDAEAVVGRSPERRPLARRATSLLVVLQPPPLPASAALVMRGHAVGDAATRIDGRDSLLADPDCADADSGTVGGAVVRAATDLALDATQLVGAPPLVLDAALADAALADAAFAIAPPPDGEQVAASDALRHDGDLLAPQLAPQLAGDGSCQVTDAAGGNWGDPLRRTACADHAPHVHVTGDLVAPRGAGQGVLVVEGDLVLRGDFRFHGVVLVRGRLRAESGAAHVLGALLLAGDGAAVDGGVPALPAAHELHGVRVRWSACAVRAALRAIGVVRPASGQPWRPGW